MTKVINASKGKCGNHKLKSPHVTLRCTSLREVSMSVKIRRECPIEGHNAPSARLIALPPTSIRSAISPRHVNFIVKPIPSIVLTTYSPSASPSPRHKSFLIDLKDWVNDDGPFRPSHKHPQQLPPPNDQTTIIRKRASNQLRGPRPNFAKATPSPPRRPSFNTPRSVSASATSLATNIMLMPQEPDQPHTQVEFINLSTTDSTRRA